MWVAAVQNLHQTTVARNTQGFHVVRKTARSFDCEDCDPCEVDCNHGNVVRLHTGTEHEASVLGRCCQMLQLKIGSEVRKIGQLAKRWLARNYN